MCVGSAIARLVRIGLIGCGVGVRRGVGNCQGRDGGQGIEKAPRTMCIKCDMSEGLSPETCGQPR